MMVESAADGVLTNARNLLWNAIDNWEPLQAGGQQDVLHKFKFNEGGEMTPEGSQPTSLSELPAIAIFPSNLEVTPEYQRGQRLPYTLEIHMWTRDWVLPRMELLWENVINAAYQSADDGRPPYIKDGLGHHPRVASPLSFTRAHFKGSENSLGPRMLQGKFSMTLFIAFSSYS